MLASEAGIVFPALALHEDDIQYFDVSGVRDMQWVGYELVDSAGQRFLVREFAAIPLPWDRGTPLWKRWLDPHLRPRHCEAELEPLPPEPFEETLRKVLEKEKALEANWVEEGGGPDTPERWERYRRSRTIAEIIDCDNYEPPGSPTVADSIVQDLHRLWRWMTFRGGRKR